MDSQSLMLQMDIEGAEYQVLAACPTSTLERFRIMVIEFHGLGANLLLPGRRSLAEQTLRKLSSIFDVVHVHPNNCCPGDDLNGLSVPRAVEVTLLNKNRRRKAPRRVSLPHELDRQCVPYRPPYELEADWPTPNGA